MGGDPAALLPSPSLPCFFDTDSMSSPSHPHCSSLCLTNVFVSPPNGTDLPLHTATHVSLVFTSHLSIFFHFAHSTLYSEMQLLGQASANQSEVPGVRPEDVSALLRQRKIFQRRNAVRKVRTRRVIAALRRVAPFPSSALGSYHIGSARQRHDHLHELRVTNARSSHATKHFTPPRPSTTGSMFPRGGINHSTHSPSPRIFFTSQSSRPT